MRPDRKQRPWGLFLLLFLMAVRTNVLLFGMCLAVEYMPGVVGGMLAAVLGIGNCGLLIRDWFALGRRPPKREPDL